MIVYIYYHRIIGITIVPHSKQKVVNTSKSSAVRLGTVQGTCGMWTP